MTKPVLVTSPVLLERRAEWAEDYELHDLSSGPPVGEQALQIEAIASAGEHLPAKLLDTLPRLALVACFSTGYAGIDLPELRARGIALTTAAGVNAHDVADHALALMLCWWHRIPEADRRVREGRWRESMVPRPTLAGRRAGIVGLGRIGLQLGQRLATLGLSVAWWGPHEKQAAPFPRLESLIALAQSSDMLFVTSRASADNVGQIDHAVLSALGASGLLVNVSRGSLVDEEALIRALHDGTIAGAALDVFAQEPTDASLWRELENVILAPHLSGYTREAGIAMFGQLRENLRRHFAGEPLLTPVTDY